MIIIMQVTAAYALSVGCHNIAKAWNDVSNQLKPSLDGSEYVILNNEEVCTTLHQTNIID